MITLHFTTSDGATQTIQGKPGQSLMQAAEKAGLPGIAADCGGSLTCATCHVKVDSEWASRLPQASADEEAMLDFTASPREAHSRLSCQIALTPELDGLVVHLPPTQ
ncbi:MAG: 2Fe-2S iron-sulfur cluster-binding protein, partial [Burkholderiaceae bacterium]